MENLCNRWIEVLNQWSEDCDVQKVNLQISAVRKDHHTIERQSEKREENKTKISQIANLDISIKLELEHAQIHNSLNFLWKPWEHPRHVLKRVQFGVYMLDERDPTKERMKERKNSSLDCYGFLVHNEWFFVIEKWQSL